MKTAAPSPTDPDIDRAQLQQIMARFASDHTLLAKERRALPQTPRAQLEMLLREISETLMPRHIEVTRNGAFTVQLTVANRRLLSISGGAGRTPLTAVKHLAAGLLEVSKQGKSLSSRTAVAHRSADGFSQGATVAMLRKELGLDTPVCDFSHLKNLLSASAEAQMTWTADMQNTVFEGSEIWRDLLQAHGPDRQRQQPAAPRATTGVALPLSKDKVLVVAHNRTGGTAAVTPLSAGLKAISTWQIAFEKPH
ncbi:MAG: hypothetical protein V2I76_04105 [Roseobacter sp.]|jgi:hypothetical protein|nr:hypothetical protein [Roseobacter sp.]